MQTLADRVGRALDDPAFAKAEVEAATDRLLRKGFVSRWQPGTPPPTIVPVALGKVHQAQTIAAGRLHWSASRLAGEPKSALLDDHLGVAALRRGGALPTVAAILDACGVDPMAWQNGRERVFYAAHTGGQSCRQCRVQVVPVTVYVGGQWQRVAGETAGIHTVPDAALTGLRHAVTYVVAPGMLGRCPGMPDVVYPAAVAIAVDDAFGLCAICIGTAEYATSEPIMQMTKVGLAARGLLNASGTPGYHVLATYITPDHLNMRDKKITIQCAENGVCASDGTSVREWALAKQQVPPETAVYVSNRCPDIAAAWQAGASVSVDAVAAALPLNALALLLTGMPIMGCLRESVDRHIDSLLRETADAANEYAQTMVPVVSASEDAILQFCRKWRTENSRMTYRQYAPKFLLELGSTEPAVHLHGGFCSSQIGRLAMILANIGPRLAVAIDLVIRELHAVLQNYSETGPLRTAIRHALTDVAVAHRQLQGAATWLVDAGYLPQCVPGADYVRQVANGMWAENLMRCNLALTDKGGLSTAELPGALQGAINNQKRYKGVIRYAATDPPTDAQPLLDARLGLDAMMGRFGGAHGCDTVMRMFGVTVTDTTPFVQKKSKRTNAVQLRLYRGMHGKIPCVVRVEPATRHSGGKWVWDSLELSGSDTETAAGSSIVLLYQVALCIVACANLCNGDHRALVRYPVAAALAMHPEYGLVSVMILPLLGSTMYNVLHRDAPTVEPNVELALLRLVENMHRRRAAGLHADAHPNNIAFVRAGDKRLCLFDPGHAACSLDGVNARSAVARDGIPLRMRAYLAANAPALGATLDAGGYVAIDAIAASLPIDIVYALLAYVSTLYKRYGVYYDCIVARQATQPMKLVDVLRSPAAEKFDRAMNEVASLLVEVPQANDAVYSPSQGWDSILSEFGEYAQNWLVAHPGAHYIDIVGEYSKNRPYASLFDMAYAVCATGLGRAAFVYADVAQDLVDGLGDVLAAWRTQLGN